MQKTISTPLPPLTFSFLVAGAFLFFRNATALAVFTQKKEGLGEQTKKGKREGGNNKLAFGP